MDAPECGDNYIFWAIDGNTKLIPSYHIGKRNEQNTDVFIRDLAMRAGKGCYRILMFCLRSAQGEQRCVQMRQDFVVQDPPGAPVNNLAFCQSLSL